MLRRVLKDNNHPNWLLKKRFNQFKFSKFEKQDKSKNYKGIITLSYLQDITEILNHIITKQNIRVSTKPLQTIKQILPHLKRSN